MTNLPSYLTAVVAVIVAWIALQQYLLAREKFKLDLFGKRFGVYKAAQKFLSCIMRNPNNIEPNDALEYLRDTQDAVFLFKQEIVDYLDSLYKKAHLMRSLQKKSEPLPVGSERTALCEQESKLVKELVDELPKLKDVFGPYLRFKVWK